MHISTIVDRMRANLAAARIALSDADLEALREGPLLNAVRSFEQLPARGGEIGLPDYLGEASDGAASIDPGWMAPVAPAATAGSGSRSSPSIASDSLQAAAERIRTREISPVELTRQALERIAERDAVLNAFQLVLGDRAMEAARRAECEIMRGTYRGPLHGVPVAVKDLMDLAGTATTAGSRVLAGVCATSDSAAAERLEQAGAIVVGKTRMSEFAYFPGSSNAHFGPTRNPHDLARDAGGSSSGSAVAVADGMVYAAIGSDTGGSVRIPAALCGIVGLKPTWGRISVQGVVPLSWSLDHLGPLTRTVGDAAILLHALSEPVPRHAGAATGGELPLHLDTDADVRGMRVGVPAVGRTPDSLASDAAWAAAHAALAVLESSGAKLIPVEVPELEQLSIVNNVILAAEAAAFHEPWLQSRLADYGEIPRRRLLAAYAHAPNAFVRAQRTRRAARERMLQLFQRIDLIALPTQPDGAPLLGSWSPTLLTAPFNALGWPAITVPAGTTPGGLPLGLQLVAQPWNEELVLRAGRIVEG